MVWRGVPVLVVVAVLGLAAPAAAQDGLTVYSSFPHAGASRAQSDDIVAAARLALEDHGGAAGGRSVTLVPLSSGTAAAARRGDGRTAANARRAARDPAAIAYLGERHSTATGVSLPITNAAGLVQVSPSNSYIGLNRSDRHVTLAGTPDRYQPTGARTFGRVFPADDREADALAAYLAELGVRRVAVLHDFEVYGRGLSHLLRERLPDRGIAVAWHCAPHSGPRSVRRVVRRLRGVRADALVFTGVASDAATRLWGAVHRAHPRWRLLGASGVAVPAFARRIPPGAARRTRLTLPTLDASAYPPSGQAVIARVRERTGREPDPLAVHGYEAMAVVLDAIDRASDPARRDAVVAAYFATRERQSVLGPYSVDEFGDATLGTYGGYRIRAGRIAWDGALGIAP